MLSKIDLIAIRNLIQESEKALKNEVVKFKDEILGRLDKIEQDLAIMNGYGDQLEDHETRIKNLEKSNLTQ